MATKKHGRNKLACAAYKASGTLDRNAKRRLRRHIRNNPGDMPAISMYESRHMPLHGTVADIGLTSKGSALEQRYLREAKIKARQR